MRAAHGENSMRKKRIGTPVRNGRHVPVGADRRHQRARRRRRRSRPVEISYLKDDGVFPYDLILDRISHEVPFYRTYLKCAAASGVQIVNNPIWWSADDKFFDNLVAKAAGVAVPTHRAPAAQAVSAEHRGEVVPQHADG